MNGDAGTLRNIIYSYEEDAGIPVSTFTRSIYYTRDNYAVICRNA